MQHIIIVGCGDIGQRVARLWIEHGRDVFALARNRRRAADLREIHVSPVIGDLDHPATLVNLQLQNALVYYFAPPPDVGNGDPRMNDFIDCLTDHNYPARIIYISTTGVYGNCNGKWVSEQTPVNPQNERSRKRVAAEKLLKKCHDTTAIPIVILRVAGIYGPERLPIERIKSGQPVLNEKEAPYSNRIHAEDLARICLKAGEQVTPGFQTYNVSDGHPTTMTDYFNRVATLAGLPLPAVISMEEAGHNFSPMMLSFLKESKRVCNRKMLRELAIELRYPDLDTGLKTLSIRQ